MIFKCCRAGVNPTFVCKILARNAGPGTVFSFFIHFQSQEFFYDWILPIDFIFHTFNNVIITNK